ncbi:homeodomain-interacting protein kinase 1-like [Morone saxatilis]|uniref:homeodomain-interacting protein kinase 1-like n=1 Tax=Morone saxatilis TaxID=34816 RepID=UPI0015E21201|nr:homeodomain-interacting protein kinase 1-like [Morone saxatilis]
MGHIVVTALRRRGGAAEERAGGRGARAARGRPSRATLSANQLLAQSSPAGATRPLPGPWEPTGRDTVRTTVKISTNHAEGTLVISGPHRRTGRMPTGPHGLNRLSRKEMERSSDNHSYPLPSEYKFLRVLGEGGFGEVLKCWKKDTKQNVALKIPKFLQNSQKEVFMLKKFMHHKFDEKNIVKFLGWFHIKFGRALVFETLHISIEDYIFKNRNVPLLLSDIRTIIQQVVTAFEALKSVGVIHTDVKPDNIMLVDHKRPFRVKLIDFGLAIPTSETKLGMTLQTVLFRSPEIILGLPFSEAIDMWSLGCVMLPMMCGYILFCGNTEYEILRHIVHLLGQPPDHLLDNRTKTKLYFQRTKSNSWRLKICLEWDNEAEDVEREQCVELLKAMLKMDAAERITPSEVLAHPFFAKRSEVSASGSVQWRTKERTRFKETKKTTQQPSSSLTVRPAAPLRKRTHLESNICLHSSGNETSGADWECPSSDPKDDNTTKIPPDHCSTSLTTPPSRVIMVRPATAENTLKLEDEDTTVSTKKKKNCNLRIFSWMKKTFCPCMAPADVDEEK